MSRREINRESAAKSRVMAPELPAGGRRWTEARADGTGPEAPLATRATQRGPSTKTPARRSGTRGGPRQPPDMQHLGAEEGACARAGAAGVGGAYRRRGQAGPPDGLGAGVQRRVLVLREGGMHGKVRLLAVHGHHLDALAWKYPQTLAKSAAKCARRLARPPFRGCGRSGPGRLALASPRGC